jgi:MFS transporter, ACS family, aldohexuronate transporter
VFVLCSSVNFLDRQLLAALAPSLKNEFHLTSTQYGEVLSAFALAYAAGAPLMGILVDRIGLEAGVSLAVGAWGLAGAATGLTRTFTGLLGCRTALGLGESAGMPALSKANGSYLKPREFGLSLAFNHIAISMGGAAAPLAAALMAPRYGWRSPFVLCGLLGLGWVPLWLFTSRRIPARQMRTPAAPLPFRAILRDRRIWGLSGANALIMTVYAVWTNWTTLYFVQQLHLTEAEANRKFAWIPPVFATLGGFAGGGLAYRWIRGGTEALAARLRGSWVAALCLLGAAAIPWMPTPAWAAAAISASLFWAMSLQCNLHAIPIDLYGPARAASGASILACSYGLMQVAVSPAVGAVVDRFGFQAVCGALAVLPLLGVYILSVTLRNGKEGNHEVYELPALYPRASVSSRTLVHGKADPR